MRINKWIPIVLAINIGVLCFALYVATTYQQQNYIVSCEQPITNYSILEVNCRGHRMHSTVKIAYAGKDYYVGVSRELCKNIGQAEFFYDMQHDTVGFIQMLNMTRKIGLCNIIKMFCLRMIQMLEINSLK